MQFAHTVIVGDEGVWKTCLQLQFMDKTFQTKVALRVAEVVSKLGAFGLKLLSNQRRGESSAKRRARVVELRTILTKLGPFVKIGQGLSTRPDLCPSKYLEELSELQVTFIL